MSDHTFDVDGLTITVSPRADGLVFVYLDTETGDDLHKRLRVRINEAPLVDLDDAAEWCDGVWHGIGDGLRAALTDRTPDEQETTRR